MGAMDEPAQREKDLYLPVKTLMGSREYSVIPQFETFSPLTRRKRKLDLLGFRWVGKGDLGASAFSHAKRLL